MPEIIIRRKHYDKAIARKVNIDKVHPEFVDGIVKGLRLAFDQNEYDIDLSEVEAYQARIRQLKKSE